MPNNTAPARASIDNTRMTRTASGVKLAYLASSQQGNSASTPALSSQHNNEPSNHAGTNIPPSSPSTHAVNSTTHKPLARERPFARDEYSSNTNPNSRPPSIRSATSFGRPLNRFMPGHHARHHSNYSNFSTMSETALPWTTRDIGFNAISGVLNDPAKSKDLSKPNKADIPPVSHAAIPKIKTSDFESYLNHIGPSFERYQQYKLTSKEAEDAVSYPPTPNITASVPGEDEEALSPFGRHPTKRTGRNPYSLPQHVLSNESLLDDDAKTPPRELPMIENVPSIFFEPDFLLENPHVFDTVCEGADIIGNSGPNPSISTNSILQEKLSYYLDTVEVHLLGEIENRSSSFFEALSNLQALHQQTLDCVSQIHTIRQKMKQIQNTECKDGLEIIRLQVRKRNLEKLHRVTTLVKNIRSAQPMIQILLGQGDYFAALDLIDETRDVLSGKNSSSDDQEPMDLTSVKALSNFSSQLDEMERAVGVMMQHDFLSILLSDLSYKIESLDPGAAKQSLLALAERASTSTDTNNTSLDEVQKEKDLKERMTPSALGLLRTNMLTVTLQGYRDRLMVEVKDIIRKRYPSTSVSTPAISSPSDEQQMGNMAKQLKSMPFSSFFQMLLDIFSSLMAAIQRASVYHQLLLQIVETQYPNTDFLIQISKESADIVFSAADLAHVRCGKLIGFRNDQNTLLNPTDFYRLSSVVRAFISQCEMYCGRTCFGLRGTVLSQQKAFVEHFHMERVKQEAQLIENEQWAASEVPSDFQLIVDRICEGKIDSLVYGSAQPESSPAVDSGGTKSTKHLIIGDHSYYIVGCSLLILKMFEDYLKCVFNLENMTLEIMQKLVELLKLFNSRVCQVILGAGAMRSAGLKNITAKHLALASQSLAVMIALIPKLKECISGHLTPKQVSHLLEFDRVVNDYKNHQGEIHAKLVAIMNERFAAHAKAMQAIQWGEEEPQTGKNANIYMETLVTETVRLHKVLAKYLPVTDLKCVMSQVFESFTTQLLEQIKHADIKTERGKNRLARDAAYFTRRLKSLHHVDPPSNSVMEAVDSIQVSEAEVKELPAIDTMSTTSDQK
ncbi:vps54-domain-containing protein [Mucor ambiguus]|uniref:Vacuolar protein sorting-associated protein 54 n=1 Tax=Mucor ambiguus TaxID=91626 RepID=A0A0C9MWS7_9FUNG|nr:vps54-domain-containing protein [Mucor ambiguus]